MRNWKTHRCILCNKVYKEIGAFETHMRKEHPGEIPEGWTIRRYVYFIHTGQTAGKCRICGKPTGWNEAGGKYVRLCNDPECKKKYREKFMADMRARRGTTKPMDDPKVREKMLVNRRIAGVYEFQDGGKVPYMGKLEEGFLKMLDTFFRFPSADIIGPSPNRYVYYYKNPEDPEREGEHVYIPDFYIPSLNLEIELKSAKNERPDHLKIDVVRDACKDVSMLRNPTVNYIKIYEDDYHVFFQVFADFAACIDIKEMPPVKYISRSLLTSVYLQHIPTDCLQIIKKYVYKYSEASVLKQRPATEAELAENPYEEVAPVIVEDPAVINENYEEPNGFADDVYSNDVHEAIADAEGMDDPDEITEVSIGLDPYIYYALSNEVLAENRPTMESFHIFEFPEENPKAAMAMEGFWDNIDTKTTAGRAALQNSRWRDKLFGNNLVGKLVSKMTVKVQVKNKEIFISGINCNLLVYRLKECYDESRLKYIFEYNYNAKSLKEFNAKRISRGAMKIDSLHTPEFFTMELVTIFTELADRYRDNSYRMIAESIYQNTWLAKADQVTLPDTDLSPLSALKFELLPHQKEFIKNWDRLKARLNMNGYILAFQPGKGKTLTAVGLSECIRASHVWIVCPNNLKDNWALEIRKYYERYSDPELWAHDVKILDGKTSIEGVKFIIVNNESIKNMQAVAFKDPNSMIIVDECHNFRNYFGTRSAELFKLVDTIGSENVLCMSATPIKAAPSEITPALRCIDPTFTDDVARMYAKCFAIDDVAAMRIIEKRFGLIMWRPPVTVDLPEKTVADLSLAIKGDESRFYLDEVHDEIVASFRLRHEKWLEENKAMIQRFDLTIKEWSKAPRDLMLRYLEWTKTMMNSTRVRDDTFHELEVEEFKQFIDKYIVPSRCPSATVSELRVMERTITLAAKVAMGKAIGEILPPRRNEMYIQLFQDNVDKFIEMIRNRSKKTVIFSTMVPVVNAIYKTLNGAGVKTVMITGVVNNRLPILSAFKDDQTVEVLVATSQTLGVGLTLTEASQMFFFGAPWRSADYEQACDRIWRIGQTDAVNIFNVMLASRKKNLSQRMKDILDWSGRMFSAAITDTAAIVGEEPATEADSPIQFPGERLLLSYFKERAGFHYGYHVNGMLYQGDECPDEYTTTDPKTFEKLRGGTCYDYGIDFFFWALNRQSLWNTTEGYFVWMGDEESCHVIMTIHSQEKYYWVECADKSNLGVYEAQTQYDILSSFINTHPHGKRIEVFQIRKEMWPKLIGLTHPQFVEYVTDKGKHLSGFKPNSTQKLRNLAALDAAYEQYQPIQFGSDYHYTEMTDPNDMKRLTTISRVHNLHTGRNFTFWLTPNLRSMEEVQLWANDGDSSSQSDWAQTIHTAVELVQDIPDTMILVMHICDPIDGVHFFKPTIVIPWSGAYIVPDVAPCPGGMTMSFAMTLEDVVTHYYRRFRTYSAPGPGYYQAYNERYSTGKPFEMQAALIAPENALALIQQNPTIMEFANQVLSRPDCKTLIMPKHAQFYTMQILNHGVVTSHTNGYWR